MTSNNHNNANTNNVSNNILVEKRRTHMMYPKIMADGLG
jgi:hypothetical protein